MWNKTKLTTHKVMSLWTRKVFFLSTKRLTLTFYSYLDAVSVNVCNRSKLSSDLQLELHLCSVAGFRTADGNLTPHLHSKRTDQNSCKINFMVSVYTKEACSKNKPQMTHHKEWALVTSTNFMANLCMKLCMKITVYSVTFYLLPWKFCQHVYEVYCLSFLL